MKLKILLCCYFGGAGGKFIGNCLSLSGQVAFPNYEIFLDYWISKNIFKLEQALLNTIPSKSESRTWLHKENGCRQLFGDKIDQVKGGLFPDIREFNHLDQFHDIWLPIMTHTAQEVNAIQKYFDGHSLFSILIKGDPVFIDKAIRLKWPESFHCLNLNLFREFNQSCNDMHVDHVIEDWNPLIFDRHAEIEILAEKLAIEYSNDLAKNYIKKYVEFHV